MVIARTRWRNYQNYLQEICSSLLHKHHQRPVSQIDELLVGIFQSSQQPITTLEHRSEVLAEMRVGSVRHGDPQSRGGLENWENVFREIVQFVPQKDRYTNKQHRDRKHRAISFTQRLAHHSRKVLTD